MTNPSDVTNKIIPMSTHSSRVLLSTLVVQANHDTGFLHIDYPEVDERNHKTLDALRSKLSRAGMTDVADALAEQPSYLFYTDLSRLVKIYHEIENDSVGITVELHYRGMMNAEAAAFITQQNQAANEGLAQQMGKVHSTLHGK